MKVQEYIDNGLCVIVEEIPHLESVAYDLSIPGGVILNNNDAIGSSLILAELTSRGAGGMSSKELSDAFDLKGIRHVEGAGGDRYIYRGSCLSEYLPDALKLLSDMILRPELDSKEIEGIKDLFIQDLESLVDNPGRRVIQELTKVYYPAPFNRSSYGTIEGLKNTNVELLRSEWERSYKPKGAILSIAGKLDAKKVLGEIGDLFKGWGGDALPRPVFEQLPKKAYHHIPYESSQLQIVLAYPSATFDSEFYYIAKVANGILSSGMSGRLFIEVREKRGLCYSVYSRHSTSLEAGTVMAYAGTTTDRAQETFDVLKEQIEAQAVDISEEELTRSKVNLVSALLIDDEASSSRASGNLSDWRLGGRLRDLEEIQRKIESVSDKDIQRYVETFSPSSFTLLTLGSEKLNF